MLSFLERDNPVDLVDALPRLLTIDHAETTMFRSHDELLTIAGSWGRFFSHLYYTTRRDEVTWARTEGEVCGIRWTLDVADMPITCGDKTFAGRYARWLNIKMGNEILIAALYPCVYYEPNGYVDHRFIVASSSETLPPLAILFADEIMAPETKWTLSTDKHKNTA